MAVTQISQIQVRYGLQEDLGNLAAGEFAWAIDTQRLYIGNGTVEEGAPFSGVTELMTGSFDISEILGNYTYRGLLGGYEVTTGPNESAPVVRSFQDKIDDFVNVRDFGVSASGNADETDNLQRAIDELYNRRSPVTGQRTRRALRLNGGTYLIQGELRIPPYATFIGEGMDSVRIVLSGDGARFTTTGGGDPGAEIVLGQYPYSVSFKGMTIESTTSKDMLTIDGSTDIVFEDVAFVGFDAMPTDTTSGACVNLKSTVQKTSGIYFNRCTFKKAGYAVYIESEVGTSDIVFNNCRFNELWSAVYTLNAGTEAPSNIKISNSIFEDIYSNAIFGDAGVVGIISTGNTYINTASRYQGDSGGSNWDPIIVFQASGNYSVADIFARSPADSRTMPRISADNCDCVYLSIDEYFALGTAQFFAGRAIGVESGATFALPVRSLPQGLINYSFERDNDRRTGVINFSVGTNNVVWADDYTETADIGVLVDLSVDNDNNNMLLLNGTTTDTGAVTKVSFDVKTLS
jgi:hypothetical protein